MAPKRRIFAFDREFWITEGFSDVQAVTMLSKIDFRGESPGGCWEWVAYINNMGYGVTSVNNNPSVAHRIVYHMLESAVEEDLHLHHRCENRRCVNPDHLQPVTPVQHLALTPQAITHLQKAQTHCKNGHALTSNNLMSGIGGKRRCKTCARDWQNRKNALAREDRGPRQKLTHCKNGHEFTEENTRIYKGVRFCRTCHNIKTNKDFHDKQEALREAAVRGEIPVEMAPKIRVEATHCLRGHLLPEVGNQPSMPKARICLVCATLRARLYQFKKRGNAAKVAELTSLLALSSQT